MCKLKKVILFLIFILAITFNASAALHTINITLVDLEEKPMTGVHFRMFHYDGTIIENASGVTDENGSIINYGVQMEKSGECFILDFYIPYKYINGKLIPERDLQIIGDQTRCIGQGSDYHFTVSEINYKPAELVMYNMTNESLNLAKESKNMADKSYELSKIAFGVSLISIFITLFLYFITKPKLNELIEDTENINQFNRKHLTIYTFFSNVINMFGLQMFDVNDDELRERKLKFIEILLIVGGIVGGIQLKSGNNQMNVLFGLFLVSSIFYYFLVSNKMISNKWPSQIAIKWSMAFISSCFSGFIILQFILERISIFYAIVMFLLFVVLTVLVFLALYIGRMEEIEEIEESKAQ